MAFRIPWKLSELIEKKHSDLTDDQVEQHIISCTVVTRPSNPPTGQHIFDTDTFKTYKNVGTPEAPVWEEYTSASGNNATQVFSATAGQTLFNLTEFTYTTGQNQLLVFISGLKQNITETSDSSFTIDAAPPLDEGTVVEAFKVLGGAGGGGVASFDDTEGDPTDTIISASADGTSEKPARRDHQHKLNIDGNVDFKNYKAIALACDNGTEFPANPVTGQWFYHTTIKTLFIYEGAWKPIISFGAINIYVNAGKADDSGDGYSLETAKKTFTAGWSCVPAIYGGTVTITVTSGTYNEQFTPGGKTPSGPYNIYVNGEVSTPVPATVANIFSTTTIGNSGVTWTIDAYKGMFVEITSGTGSGQYGVIISNTATTLTIAGTWDTVPNGTSNFKIITPTTIIDRGGAGTAINNSTQVNMYFRYFKIQNVDVGISQLKIRANYTEFDISATSFAVSVADASQDAVILNGCSLKQSATSWQGAVYGSATIQARSWIHDCGYCGLLLLTPSQYIYCLKTTISNCGSYAARIVQGMVRFNGSIYVSNNNSGGVGITAQETGKALGISSVTFAGQSVNYNTDGNSLSYVG